MAMVNTDSKRDLPGDAQELVPDKKAIHRAM